MKRIAVFGAGAIGGYLAWQLASAGQTVSVVARGAQLAAIRERGLIVEINGKAATPVHVIASDDPGSLGPQDIVFVTLKQPSIADAVEGLATLSSPQTSFAFATNGIPWWMEPELDLLDRGGRLAKLIAPSMRVGCVVKVSAAVRVPGVISLVTSSGRFIIGPAGAEAASAAAVMVDLLGDVGIVASFNADLKPAVWDKLLLNIGFGLPAAILDLPVGQVARQAEAQRLLKGLFQEVRAIAQSRGVRMTTPDSIVTDPAILSSPHLPSLLQDFRRGRPAEIDALVTAPLSLARQAGLATPILDVLGPLVIAKAQALGCHPTGGRNHAV